MSSIKGAKAFPRYPTLLSVRLATVKDIPRMAALSVLGFRDSEIFHYERPRYEDFPLDAIASFTNIYRSQMLDPRSVVIVAEDSIRSEEESYFPPSPLKDGVNTGDDDIDDTKRDTERVVVGVASWVLPEGSLRTGQFVVSDVGELEPSLGRDLCQSRFDIFTRIYRTTEKEYFIGMAVCDKLVVHPSYQGRGHATSMLRWGLRLCDMDGIGQGVIPSHHGEPVYLALGYKVVGEMHVPDDGEVEGFTQRVLKYKAERQNQ